MLYIIHFDRPYKHAGHYRGMCRSGGLADRLATHRAGRGARLIQVIQQAGIGWECVWTGPGGRAEERLLKKRRVADVCPVCRAAAKLATAGD